MILFVDACLRPGSRTRALADAVLKRADEAVQTLRLYDAPPRPLDLAMLERRDRGDFDHPDFLFAGQFAQADTVVIAAPCWDLLFPAVLRAYLEQITVVGLTFRYNEQGRPEGLCRGKKLIYVTTCGGHMGENDLGFAYVKALAENFYGIEQVCRVAAEGLDIFGADPEAILEEAKKKAAGIL